MLDVPGLAQNCPSAFHPAEGKSMRTHPSPVDFWYFMVVGEFESVMPFSGITTDKWSLAPAINLPATLMWTTRIKLRGSHTQTGIKVGWGLGKKGSIRIWKWASRG